MAQTLENLREAVTAISVSNERLAVAVDAEIAQAAKTTEAIDALIARIGEGGNATDFTAEVEALVAERNKMEATTDKLAADNTAVQEAIDRAVPPTPGA